MNLSDRLDAEDPETEKTVSKTWVPGKDPMSVLHKQIADSLYDNLGERLFDATITEKGLREMVSTQIDRLIDEFGAPLRGEERRFFIAEIVGDLMGFGPVEPYLADPQVSEVMVNSTNPIYVERNGKLEQTSSTFESEEHLRRVIDRIVTLVGRRVDESSPMVDARLSDGSRVNAIIPPLAVDGSALTIRKFANDKLGMDQLVELGAITRSAADLLEAAVEGALTMLVSGGTGTGKTTLLNSLSAAIPSTERIVTIEDSVELQLRQTHVVRLESRPPNIEGRGEVTVRDLVKNSLRMRPDRIIVGEVRGSEALDMIQAINTGHDGSLATIHANSPRDALARLETMVLMAGFELPLRAIREQIASGVDVVVQLTRFGDGSRKVTQISEIVGMEGDIITMSDLYEFDHAAGIDFEGKTLGKLIPTGLRPSFMTLLAEKGIVVGHRLSDLHAAVKTGLPSPHGDAP